MFPASWRYKLDRMAPKISTNSAITPAPIKNAFVFAEEGLNGRLGLTSRCLRGFCGSTGRRFAISGGGVGFLIPFFLPKAVQDGFLALCLLRRSLCRGCLRRFFAGGSSRIRLFRRGKMQMLIFLAEAVSLRRLNFCSLRRWLTRLTTLWIPLSPRISALCAPPPRCFPAQHCELLCGHSQPPHRRQQKAALRPMPMPAPRTIPFSSSSKDKRLDFFLTDPGASWDSDWFVRFPLCEFGCSRLPPSLFTFCWLVSSLGDESEASRFGAPYFCWDSRVTRCPFAFGLKSPPTSAPGSSVRWWVSW